MWYRCSLREGFDKKQEQCEMLSTVIKAQDLASDEGHIPLFATTTCTFTSEALKLNRPASS
jgi:hypothetical protein